MPAKRVKKKKDIPVRGLFEETRSDDATKTLPAKPTVDEIFSDPAARRNIVGLYELLYEIDRRINPQFYGLPERKDDAVK